MRSLDLAWKDLIQTLRDWRAALFLLIMPMAFTVFIGFLFGGFDGDEDPRLPVGFLNQDLGGALAGELLRLLDMADTIRPVVLEDEDAAGAADMVRDGDLAGAVIVPRGYSSTLLQGDLVAPTLIADEASEAGSTAINSVQGAVFRLLGSVEIGRLTTEAIDAEIGVGGDAERTRLLEATAARAVEAWADPPLSIEVMEATAAVSDDEGLAPSANRFAHSSPAMMVQFSITVVMATAQILVAERKSRALKRL